LRDKAIINILLVCRPLLQHKLMRALIISYTVDLSVDFLIALLEYLDLQVQDYAACLAGEKELQPIMYPSTTYRCTTIMHLA